MIWSGLQARSCAQGSIDDAGALASSVRGHGVYEKKTVFQHTRVPSSKFLIIWPRRGAIGNHDEGVPGPQGLSDMPRNHSG